MAKTKTKDEGYTPHCEFFEEAGGEPPSCLGVVTKAIWIKHVWKEDPKQEVLVYSCTAHAGEFMREKGFVRMEPFKRRAGDAPVPKKLERKRINWGS